MQPEVVEKLVGMREGIPRKDAKEVITSSFEFDSISPKTLMLPTQLQYF